MPGWTNLPVSSEGYQVPATGECNFQERIVVVGSGWHFASGISHYTYKLSSALADDYAVGALLMRDSASASLSRPQTCRYRGGKCRLSA